MLYAGLDTQAVVWLRAWFRYLRQTGSSFGLVTIVDALRRAPNATRALIGLFVAAHDPSATGRDERRSTSSASELDASLAKVRSIDDDRILRRLRALVEAIVRTNAFAPAADEALAFKINSSLVPGLPRAGAVARDLGLQPARRRHPPARRPGRSRRHPLVGPARRLPHRDPRPDEGAAGQERGDRSDRRQGRLLSQAASADVEPRRLARRGHRKLPDLHPLAAVDHRQPRQRQGRASRAASSSTTATIPISSSPPTRAPRPSPTSPTRSRSSATSGSATPSPAAARTATITRRWGSRRKRRVDLGPAALPRNGHRRSVGRGDRRRLRRHVGRRVRQRHAAVEVDQADRRVRPPPHLHRSRIPIRRRAGRSASACSSCRARAGTITTAS